MVYSAARVFDGTEWRTDAFRTRNGLVEEWVRPDALPEEDHRHFEGCSLVPAFVDFQVYGAGGRLFSQYPDEESLQLLATCSMAGGAALVQPTIATNSPDTVYRCIDAVRRYWAAGGEGIAGLHIEGPWISPEKRGAHLPEYIHPPAEEEIRALVAYGKGVVRTVTLAPELPGFGTALALLQPAGIRVSAGHSNATYAQAANAFRFVDAATHLYNAMSGLHHRAAGFVGAVFDTDIPASIIPDGIHVSFPALRIAARVMGERLFAITDAVTQTDEGPYRHQLTNGDHYTCNGTLSGSALTMHQAFCNLVRYGQVPLESALRMCSTVPAKLLGCAGRYGRIGPGAAACFLVLGENLELVGMINEPGSRSPALCGGGPPG